MFIMLTFYSITQFPCLFSVDMECKLFRGSRPVLLPHLMPNFSVDCLSLLVGLLFVCFHFFSSN